MVTARVSHTFSDGRAAIFIQGHSENHFCDECPLAKYRYYYYYYYYEFEYYAYAGSLTMHQAMHYPWSKVS